MQLVTSNIFNKSNRTFGSVVRDTSCSRGWLRLVVQLIFGAITVASFIMIVHMAMQRTPQGNKSPCSAIMCRVKCSRPPYNEQDINSAVMDAVLLCPTIQLIIQDAIFENGTLPSQWLKRLPANIDALDILGGNLRHLPPNAFMSEVGGRMKFLTLENIEISFWTSDTFMGLTNLEVLNIRKCLIQIEYDGLRAISNTLRSVTISKSGKWDPSLVTGATTITQVKIVNFSNNIFGNIISSESFTGLQFCEDLYLNNCQITSIRAGAFDPLANIRMIHLNNNYIMTISSGLFSTIMNFDTIPRPRINIQNNLLKCDCLQNELLILSNKGLLLVDPLCYHPEDMHGKPFSKLEAYCKNDTVVDQLNSQNSRYAPRLAINAYERDCVNGKLPSRNTSVFLVSPIPEFQCPFATLDNLSKTLQTAKTMERSDYNWLTTSFLFSVNRFTVVQVVSTISADGLGLIWYTSMCPNEVYCTNTLPDILRVYDVKLDTKYIFCPIYIGSSAVDTEHCVSYDLTTEFEEVKRHFSAPLVYVAIGFVCLSFGALCVYGIIRRNPYLLKGSKRLLFVKHRTVDALVLPPKVPLRNSLTKSETEGVVNKRVFSIPNDANLLCPGKLMRSDSVRSDKSCTPTYISALQPTEAQLAEWRIRHHFDQSPSLTSIASELSTYSWTCESKNTIEDISYNIAYESLK